MVHLTQSSIRDLPGKVSGLRPKIKNALAAIGVAALMKSKPKTDTSISLSALDAQHLSGIFDCGLITQSVTYPYDPARVQVVNLIGYCDTYVLPYQDFKNLIDKDLIGPSGNLTDIGYKSLAALQTA